MTDYLDILRLNMENAEEIHRPLMGIMVEARSIQDRVDILSALYYLAKFIKGTTVGTKKTWGHYRDSWTR